MGESGYAVCHPIEAAQDDEAAMNTPRRRIGDLLVDVHAGDREPYSSVIEEICAIAREGYVQAGEAYTLDEVSIAIAQVRKSRNYGLSLDVWAQIIAATLTRLAHPEPKGEQQ